MNRYLQKILEIKFRFLLNSLYRFKYQSLVNSKPSTPQDDQILVSIVVPVWNPKVAWLHDCLNSVINQTYSNWQLVLVDNNSTDQSVIKVLKSLNDPRIKVIFNDTNLLMVGGTNLGLPHTKGDWVAFLDHDDVLWPNAISEVVKAINSHPEAKLIYSDQDKIDENNNHFDPFLKEDYNFNLLRQTNYFNHLTVINKQLLDKLKGLRQGTDFAQDWDLVLRATNLLKSSEIFHIPKILYSWRVSANSTAGSTGITQAQDRISKVQQEVLEYDLNSRGLKSSIQQSRYLGIWSTDNKPTILPYQLYFHSLKQLLCAL